jgi:hypothetical protein
MTGLGEILGRFFICGKAQMVRISVYIVIHVSLSTLRERIEEAEFNVIENS